MKTEKHNLSKEIKDLSKKEKVSLDNKSIFKAKDLELINEVREFLENRGLNPKLQKGIISKIRGGMLNHIKRGFLRIYNDVDLAIDTSGIKMSSEEYHYCVSVIQELTRACNENHILNGWDVKDESTNLNVYVGLIVDYRFRIYYIGKDKPKTQIDITFGEQDKEEMDNYWNNYLGL